MQEIKTTFVQQVLTQVVDYLKVHPELMKMKQRELSQLIKKEFLGSEDTNGNIGVIIHYGLYSVPAFDSDPARRSIKNGSEWYYKRLTETGKYRPVSGWKETQTFHKKHYDGNDYFSFREGITITEDKVEMWIQQAVAIKAKYVIITTKHHDGFCLYSSKINPHSEQDVVGWVAKHARAAGLKFGAYYSWMEWPTSFTKTYMEEVVEPQINEIQKKYKPDIWWFDGNWAIKSQVCKDKVALICKKLRKANSQVQMNDRGAEDFATFQSFEKKLPENNVGGKWEYIDTIGDSWGYNAHAKKEKYKSGKDLYQSCRKVTSMGGNFTINIGPKADGSLSKNEAAALKDLGKLLAKE